MNPTFRVPFAIALFAAGIACAAARAADAPPPKADPPPPPGLDDLDAAATTRQGTAATDTGAHAGAASATGANTAASADDANDPLAPPPKPDARLIRDKASRDAAATERRAAASTVTTRKQGEDTVQEYRQNGRIWMVRITPKKGPMQTFMDTDGSGRLVRDPREGPVAPVYYTLYRWK